jgi:hypothetical protein
MRSSRAQKALRSQPRTWPYDHAENLTGTLPIELGAKSLILWVYDVLMNDSPKSGVQMNNNLLCMCDAQQTIKVGM